MRAMRRLAIVLGRADAIVGLGVLVAREMGWATIPLVVMAPAEQDNDRRRRDAARLG